MFRSFSNSWQLVKASWAVLSADRELLLFPVLSGIVMVFLTIVMIVPAVGLAFAGSLGGESVSTVVNGVVVFLFYLVSYTVSIYFNTALVGAALIRLDGGDPTVRDGFRIANERLGKIVGYAAINATVGMILRAIQERAGFLGQIAVGLVGFVWNVATFLVIPVLVVKDVGPIDAVKESAGLLRKTWGEQITGNFSVGAIFGLIFVALIILGGGLVMALAVTTESAVIAISGTALVIGIFLVLLVIQGALTGIFQAVMYRYAEEGIAPDNFDIEIIQGAFKPKRKRGLNV